MHSNFFLKKSKILGENRLLVMRDLANGFIDKQDIKFEAQNNKLVIKKKILTNRNIRRDAKKHSGLAIKNPEVRAQDFSIKFNCNFLKPRNMVNKRKKIKKIQVIEILLKIVKFIWLVYSDNEFY